MNQIKIVQLSSVQKIYSSCIHELLLLLNYGLKMGEMCNRRLKSTFFEIFSSLRLQVSLGLSPLCWKTIQNMLILVFEANSMASLNYTFLEFLTTMCYYNCYSIVDFGLWPTRNILTKEFCVCFQKMWPCSPI